MVSGNDDQAEQDEVHGVRVQCLCLEYVCAHGGCQAVIGRDDRYCPEHVSDGYVRTAVIIEQPSPNAVRRMAVYRQTKQTLSAVLPLPPDHQNGIA